MRQGVMSNKKKPMFILTVLLAITFVALVVNVIYILTKASDDQEALQGAADLRVSSYRVVSLSREATSGEASAFAALKGVVDQMSGNWAGLKSSLSSELSAEQLGEFDNAWNKIKSNADTIVAEEERVLFLNKVAATLNETLPKLQQEHTQVVEILLENNAPGDQVAVAQNQTWLAERIGRNVDKMLAGGADAEAAADQFNRDANLFGRVLDGMRKGDRGLGISRVTNRSARASLEAIAEQFEFVNSSIQEIFEATPALFSARQSNNAIIEGSPVLLEQISNLSAAITSLSGERPLTNQTAFIFVALAVIFGAFFGWFSYESTRVSLKETAETNEKNQEAILRLLDEIGDLGDGDLTSHATVTEDFTGAIADSINYAIDQLGILVSQIQDTSENVSAAANETRATAMQLSDSANHQSEQIAVVTGSINEMVNSIDMVSKNASESAQVAEQSVSIAGKGGEVVRNTIVGMDTIREQIQDTSKRIKRLGESSQEIGDIVSLINDIADQTNILALNAAIQASMAGDAGRGFAVVADEVQRLAERSADATKQIGSLVKTIQSDANEAVSSMEQTTTEVVKGASLAQDAGVALEEIETVSANLEKLIQDISVASQNQSSTASQVSQNMLVIQDITSQTLLGTQATADSTGELADLAVSLRESVDGFKLPAANDEKMTDFSVSPSAAALPVVEQDSSMDEVSSLDTDEDIAFEPEEEVGLEDEADDLSVELNEEESESFEEYDIEVAEADLSDEEQDDEVSDSDLLSNSELEELEAELLADNDLSDDDLEEDKPTA